jgi:hypothetical protein
MQECYLNSRQGQAAVYYMQRCWSGVLEGQQLLLTSQQPLEWWQQH